MDEDCEADKPEHCIRGEVVRWFDEWEDEDGHPCWDEGCYYECLEWEPGYPRLMTEQASVFPRVDYTKDTAP